MKRAGGLISFAVVLATFELSGLAQQAPARRLAIEDYYRVQTVAGPSISPDGRWVIFTVSTRIEEDNSTRAETFMAPSDASAKPARLAHYGKDISGASWTSDGRLEYSAERERWTLDPQKLSTPPVKAVPLPSGAVFSADAKWIAYAKDKPQPKKERIYASDFEKRHEERFKGVTFDWKDFQRDGAPFPAPDLHARPAAQLLVQAIGGSVDAPKVLLDQDLRPSEIAWHPGGKLIAFTADPDWRDELKYGNATLWTVTTEGKVARLTDDAYVYGDVDFSPDGKYVSYVRSFSTGMIVAEKLNHGGSRDIFIRPVDGGEPVNLTAKWDLEPSDARWSPDARFIYFTAETSGENHLFRAAVPGGGVEQVTRGPRRLGGVTIDKSFRTIAYTVGVQEAPPEVFAANIDGTNERRLSDVHGRITSEIAFSKADRLRWPSKDGTEIEGWLTYPLRLRRCEGPLPPHRHEPRRAARGHRLQLRFQEAVLCRQRLLRLRHELQEFHRLRRRLQVGDVGRVGQQGRRGRRVGHRLRSETLSNRCETRRPYRSLVRRVHDELVDHAVSGQICRGHHRRRHHELDERLRHRRHLSHERDRVLRHAMGRRRT